MNKIRGPEFGNFSDAPHRLNEFLCESKKSFPEWVKRSQRIGVVMGNEASDLDSIVSSTFYAYFLQSKEKKHEGFLPIMNIAREDFKLRTETNWLFNFMGVLIDDIVFLPEVQKEFDLLHESQRLDLILVDHNRLSAHQEKYEKSVTEVIDHHQDEKKCTSAKKAIEMVGSCTSLVAEKILYSLPSLVSKADAGILLAPILLDTANLDPKHEKVKKKDEEISAKLIDILGFSKEQQNQFFEKLQHERFSVDSLDTLDLLRMDYKQWKMGKWEVGISSSKRSIKELLERDSNLDKEFFNYLKSRKLDILFCMTLWLDQKNMLRELIILTPNRRLYENTKAVLLASDLKLKEIKKDESKKLSTTDYIISFFHQHNVTASRKQLQPLLVEYYEKIGL